MAWPGGGMPPGWDMMPHGMGQAPNQNPNANYPGYAQQGMPYVSQPGYPPTQGYPGYPGQGQGYPASQASYAAQMAAGMAPNAMNQHQSWSEHMASQMIWPPSAGHPGHPGSQYSSQGQKNRPPMGQTFPNNQSGSSYASQQHQSQQPQSSGTTNVTSVYGQPMATPSPHQSAQTAAASAAGTTPTSSASMSQNGFNQNVSPMPNFNFNLMSKVSQPFAASFGKPSSSSSSSLPKRTSPVDQVQNQPHKQHHQQLHTMQPVSNLHQSHLQKGNSMMQHPSLHQSQLRRQPQHQPVHTMHQLSMASQNTNSSRPTPPQTSQHQAPPQLQPSQTPSPQPAVTQSQQPNTFYNPRQQPPHMLHQQQQQLSRQHQQQQQQQQQQQHQQQQQQQQHLLAQQVPSSPFSQQSSVHHQGPPATSSAGNLSDNASTPSNPSGFPKSTSPVQLERMESTEHPTEDNSELLIDSMPKTHLEMRAEPSSDAEVDEYRMEEEKSSNEAEPAAESEEKSSELETTNENIAQFSDSEDSNKSSSEDIDRIQAHLDEREEEKKDEKTEDFKSEEDALLRAAREAEEEEEREEEERMKKRMLIEEQMRLEREEAEKNLPVELSYAHDDDSSEPRRIFDDSSEPRRIFDDSIEPRRIFDDSSEPRRIFDDSSEPRRIFDDDDVMRTSHSGDMDEKKKIGQKNGWKKNRDAKNDRGITREAAAAAAAALVPDFDSNAVHFQPHSESSNSMASPHDDDDFDFLAENDITGDNRKRANRKPGRARYPKVQATVMNPVKKKKKHDYDEDDDELRHKKSKKRRKIDSEEEFLNPEDYLETRRSGRNQRTGRKNYDDNAVPNFVDSPVEEDSLISAEEIKDELGAKFKKKLNRKKKDDDFAEGEALSEIIEDPLIVDKILSHRAVRRKKDDESVKSLESKTEGQKSPDGEKSDKGDDKLDEKSRRISEHEEREIEEDEFFIKWKGYSYIHCVWLFRDEIFDPRFDQKTRRYYSKLAGTPDPDNEDFFNPDFIIVDRVLDVVEGTDPDSGEPTRHFLVKWCSLPYDECTWELEADVDKVKIDLFHRLNLRKKNKPFERPPVSLWRKLDHPQEFKNKCTLREYQVEGVSWLLFNWYQNRNCILADEMGLGKTIQSITFLQKIYDTGNRGPYLIVVPLSTVGNWIREFEMWTDLNAIVYHGSAQSRQMIQQYEMFQRDKKGFPKKGDFRFDALITTYEMIVADCPEIKNVHWSLMIIDEAHRLKNTKSKLADNLKQMHIQHKVLLTGTPLQNNLEELYALLNFLNPDEFYDVGYFMREYGSMANQESVERMQNILKPIMLRRLKEDVEKSLKPKEETIIEVELTNIQKKYYRAIIERNFDFLSKGASSGNVPSLMNTMMELRKCCNHPFLIKGAEDKIMNDYKVKGEDVTTLHAMVQASGKMVLIHKLLPKLQAGGHKILIFSQMIRVLDILEDYLYQMNMLFERLDGRIRGNERQAAIDRFSKPDSDRFVFLLCTRAGGLGINLTAADTVIIFDSDWNPQNDLQAQARCHRIGQKKEVKIYRLLTSKTYEREMFDRASLKLGLDRAVLQSMSGSATKNDSGGPLSNMSKKEVEDLLKKGAYGAIMDDDDAAEKFCEEDIDQILSKRATTIKHEAGIKGSTFSKATFAGAAETRMDIDINDPDFWEKWARKADLDLDALTANKLILEQPRVRKQTQRYTGAPVDEHIMDDIGSDSDSSIDGRRKKGKRGDHMWGKKESFKLQKGLLMFGWGRWQDIIKHCKLNKNVPEAGVEQISRAILALAASFYSGDDKVKQFIWELITPPEFTHELHSIASKKEQKKSKRGRESESPPPIEEGREWVIELDGLLTDDSFRKHVITHSNKLLARVKVLNYLRIEILADWLDHINDDVPSTEYELDVPVIEGDPPAPWWEEEADKSLLVGIFKHGYDRYSLIRNDPSLVFLDKVGPADDRAIQADLMEGADDMKADKKLESHELKSEGDKEYKPKHKHIFDEQQEILEAAAPNGTPPPPALTDHTPEELTGQGLPWPSPADLNKRFRMIIAAYQRIFRRAQARAQRLLNRKPPRQITERWTKREESDFYRAVSTFGTERAPNGTFKWDRFRLVAKLEKKSDMSLTNYYIAFRAMCERTCRRSTIPEEDLPAVYVEQISEDRASRTLLRIHLLDRIRRECLNHPNLEKRLKLCQPSSDLPVWWIPGKHDKELLMGMNRHGLSRCEIHILNDKDFSFADALAKVTKIPPRFLIKGEHEIKKESEDPDDRAEITARSKEGHAEISPVVEDKITDAEDVKSAITHSPDDRNDSDDPIDKISTHRAASLMDVDDSEQSADENSKSISPTFKDHDGILSTDNVKSEPSDLEEKPGEEVPVGELIEVDNEEEKSLLEAEYIKQQSANRWPKDKFLMQRAEHVCFCITQGEWPTPKLINSLTGNGLNASIGGGGVAISGGGVVVAGGAGGAAGCGSGVVGGLDSPRLSDSPASDYLRRSDPSGLPERTKHKIRSHPRPPASRTLNNLDASHHLLNKLNELAQGGQVSKEEVDTLQQLLQQSAMLGLPIEAIMNQFQPSPLPSHTESKTPQKEKAKKQSLPKPHDLTQPTPPPPISKITQEQQLKLLELEKQLQDPTMQMLMAHGLISPAALCGLDPETAKLLGIQPAPPTPSKAQGLKGLDTSALLNQPGMTPDMLQLMQMSLGGAPLQSPSPSPRTSKAKKRPLPTDNSKQDSNSRPASRSSLASSSHRAPTPSGSDAKKRKSEEKIDLASLPVTMKIPLIMSDGTKMADGVSNKELKGLLESNPSIKVDYEALEVKLERSRPKQSRLEQKAAQQHAQQKAAAAAAAAASFSGPDLASMGITPEIMAQFVNNGIDPKQLMNMASPYGANVASNQVQKKNKSDPAQQKIQLINLRTFQKLERKKCPELCLLESFLKKNPDFFVASESKDFVLKHPKYFPRTLYQRIQPDMDHMGLAGLNDPKLLQAMMMQSQMDPKAMSVLQAQQAMGGMADPKLMAMLAMDPKMAQFDPKMLQALGLGATGIDPKLLGIPGLPGLDPKSLGLGTDPKMMAALGMGGLDPKTNHAMANQAALQLQQQLAMMGMAGMDAKTLQNALSLGALDPQTLAALTGIPGMDMKSQLHLQQQQHDMQAKALAQMMGGAVDPKLLGLPGMSFNLGMEDKKPMREEKKAPTPKPIEVKPDIKSIEARLHDEAQKREAADKKADEPNDKTLEEIGEDDTKDNEDCETIPNGEEEDVKDPIPRPASTSRAVHTAPSTPTISAPSQSAPETPVPLTAGIDAATMKTLGSLGSMDPKTMKANGLDPALLKSLGLSGGMMPKQPTLAGLPHGLAPGMGRMPGMEGLDNETLKLLASGDAGAMQKLMANPASTMMGLDPRMMGLDAQTMAAFMAGQDPSKLSLAAMSQANKQMEQTVLKQLGLDAQTVQAMQQQQLQQQQLAQMGMFSLGGMDPKMLQMMGMPMDQKYLQGLQGIDQLMAQQQALGYLGGNLPGGLDAATMQQILGGVSISSKASKKTTPKKNPVSLSSGMPPASLANMEMLRQQEQLLLLTGGIKPDLNSQELQLLAQQVRQYYP